MQLWANAGMTSDKKYMCNYTTVVVNVSEKYCLYRDALALVCKYIGLEYIKVNMML